MGWVIAYFIAGIVIPTLYGMAKYQRHNDNKLTITDGEMVFILGLLQLVWPLSVTFAIVTDIRKSMKEHMILRAKGVIHDYNLKLDRNGSTASLAAAPEDKLKLLLKAYRKKYIDLTNGQVETLRNELLNRNMERNLLK